MTVLVVDACVALKWVLPEPGSEEAERILASQDRLASPRIILVEAAAAIAKRTHVGALSAAHAADIFADFRATTGPGRLTLFDDEPLLAVALQLSAALRHPLGDCLYLALAQSLDGVVVTADRKMIGAAERNGLGDRVRPL